MIKNITNISNFLDVMVQRPFMAKRGDCGLVLVTRLKPDFHREWSGPINDYVEFVRVSCIFVFQPINFRAERDRRAQIVKTNSLSSRR